MRYLDLGIAITGSLQFAICCILRYTCVRLRVAFQERTSVRDIVTGRDFYQL